MHRSMTSVQKIPCSCMLSRPCAVGADGNLVEYGDVSCAMGYCCTLRCFNAPHSWQMGWLAVTEVSCGGGRVAASHGMQEWSSIHASTGAVPTLVCHHVRFETALPEHAHV